MDIYYYGVDNTYGGMEKYAYDLISGVVLSRPDICYHIITCYSDMSYKEKFLNLGCKVIVIPKKTKIIKYYRALKKIFNKGASVHAILQLNVMSYRNVPLFLAAKKSKIKTIIVSHSANTGNLITWFVNLFFKKCYKTFGTKIGVSREALINIGYLNQKNNYIICNGVDDSNYSYSLKKRIILRKKYNISEKDFIIGQVGRVSKQKNQIFSCKLIKNLEQKNNVSLHFFGTIQDKSIDRYIRRNKLEKNIINHGSISNSNEIYNIFDLLIFPSFFEGAPLVLYESLSNGLTTIISDLIPTPLLNTNKIIPLPLKPKLWLNKINCIIKNGDININNRENCIKNTVYSIKNQIMQYVELYEKISDQEE